MRRTPLSSSSTDTKRIFSVLIWLIPELLFQFVFRICCFTSFAVLFGEFYILYVFCIYFFASFAVFFMCFRITFHSSYVAKRTIRYLFSSPLYLTWILRLWKIKEYEVSFSYLHIDDSTSNHLQFRFRDYTLPFLCLCLSGSKAV